MIGIDLRTLSHDECVNLASDIKKSLDTKCDPVIVPQLRKNLAIVENYIARTFKKREPSTWELFRHAVTPAGVNEYLANRYS